MIRTWRTATLDLPASALLARSTILQAISLALLTAVAYASTPFNFWVGDDYNYIVPKSIDRVIGFFDPTVPSRAFYRPLNWTSWAIDYALWGKSPAGWHVSSVLYHIVATLVVALIVYRLLGAWRTALMSGALFALFPAHTETVSWIGGRADLICGLFYFPAVLFFVLYLRRREREGNQARVYYGLALLMCLCALLGKEMGVTVPLVLALTDLFLYPPPAFGRAGFGYWRSRALPHLPFFGLVAAYGLMRVYLVAAHIVTNTYVGPSLLNPVGLFNAAAGNILLLAGLPIAPTGISALPGVVKLIVVIAGVAVALLLARWVGRWGWYALLWTVITILPTANLAQMRWLYIPSFGVCMLGALACNRLWESAAESRKQPPRDPASRRFLTAGQFRPTALLLVPTLLLVLWGLGTIYQNVNWYRSGEEAKSILRQIQGLVPDTQQPVTIYFGGAPTYYKTVFLFNTGLPSAMGYLYGDRKVELHEVEQPLPDPVVQQALANPPQLKPNPLFLGYKEGVVRKYPSIQSLMQAGLRKE